MEEDAVELFITMVFTCLLLSWCKMSSPFKENNNVAVFPFPSCWWPTCGSSNFKDNFPS